MIKYLTTQVYERFQLLAASFVATLIVLILAVGTGFGAGSLISRTFPDPDRALDSTVARAQEMIDTARGGDQTTAVLVQGVPIKNQEDFDKVAELFAPIRDDLARDAKLEPRKQLLDPFQFEYVENADASANPLIAQDGDGFIALALATPGQETQSAADTEKIAINEFEKLESALQDQYPQARVYINSPAYANSIARSHVAWETSFIILFGLLAAAAGFYFSAMRPATAIAGGLGVLFAAMTGLFVAWVATFIVAVPTSLVPVFALVSLLVGIMAIGALLGIDQDRVLRTQRQSLEDAQSALEHQLADALELEISTPEPSVPIKKPFKQFLKEIINPTSDPEEATRAKQIAQRVSDNFLLLLTSAAITVITVCLSLIIQLRYLQVYGSVMILATAAIWFLLYLLVPGLQLTLEYFLPSRATEDQTRTTLKSIDPTSVRGKLHEFGQRIHKHLNTSYRSTPFARNLAAPALALLFLALTALPWFALSPKASTSAELTNVSQTVHFQEVSHAQFPAMADADFSVIAKTSPTELQTWADQVASDSDLLKVESAATEVGDGKYSTINFSFVPELPTFKEQQKAFHQIVDSKPAFEKEVYSDNARNLEAIETAISGSIWVLISVALVAYLSLLLLSANAWWAAIEVAVGFLTVAGSIGSIAGLFKAGVFAYLPGAGMDHRIDLTGIFIGGFISIMLVAILLIEPLFNSRPRTTRAVWAVATAASLPAIFSGQVQPATIGLITVATVVLSIVVSLLLVPQIAIMRDDTDSKMGYRIPLINDLHQKVRNW
ncbi:hypothetical protein BK816_04265 [Boudabousia tangfeifanii]|uniref:Membrane transport protein MMPL domain-containing protein n=1 Tax=Boudabousia tangfeifanii TaxID=1912795 RepID=A0A1D9MJZ8_9ACTO|nr:hypothetical protein [Boudabousia tangfeifanii]AOZ72606.1 hypothetical protein BK816_04265 [Boudabousia tangfeifanii]